MSLKPAALFEANLQSWRFQQAEQIMSKLAAHRKIALWLFGLGLVRGILLYLAYPPAHGADSQVYFFYAEHLSRNFDVPLLTQMTPPLYPAVILLLVNGLGSIYMLLGVQFLMAASIAPIYYRAIKPYNDKLALLVGLIVLGDFQLGVMFNFTSTEPLYMFLLAIMTYVYLHQIHPQQTEDATKRGVVTGMLLALLLLTRSVARFLIVPMLLVTLIVTRSGRQLVTMLAGFAIILVLSAIMTHLAVGQIEGLSSSSNMYVRLLRSVDLEQVNGSNAEQLVATLEACDERRITLCNRDEDGNVTNSSRLLLGATVDAVIANWQSLLGNVWRKTDEFLSLSGQQLGYDASLPGTTQCQERDSPGTTHDREQLITRTTWGWTLANIAVGEFPRVFDQLATIDALMCPPLPHSDAARSIVDYGFFRYRSLGRPQPYVYYGLLLVLTILLPWARKLLPLVIGTAAILANHALVSGLLGNVQPRYVVVVNPMRTILLAILAYLILAQIVYIVDHIIAWRSNKRATIIDRISK